MPAGQVARVGVGMAATVGATYASLSSGKENPSYVYTKNNDGGPAQKFVGGQGYPGARSKLMEWSMPKSRD